MSIESEIAGLTVATNDLLEAVNVSKIVLDDKVGVSTENADTAILKAAESEASQILSTNSANLAASNVQSQLDAIRQQTETARDQAIAGLGAADNSQNLSLILAGLQQALDLAGQAADWPINVMRGEALLAGISAALDMAGVTAKQVNGGAVQLAAGSLTEPSLWGPADRNTGVFFPGADAMELVAAGLMRLHADAIGVGIGTNTPSGLLDVNDNRVRIRTAKTPASATAAGSTGEVCWDAGYVYVCTATNVWRRTALVTW